jgi:hypothetical protein
MLVLDAGFSMLDSEFQIIGIEYPVSWPEPIS